MFKMVDEMINQKIEKFCKINLQINNFKIFYKINLKDSPVKVYFKGTKFCVN